MKMFLFIFLCVFLIGCGHIPLKWTNKEKILFSTGAVGQLSDVLITHDMISSDNFKEINPVMGDGSLERTIPIKLILSIPFWAYIHWVPKTHKQREVVLYIWNASGWLPFGWNLYQKSTN